MSTAICCVPTTGNSFFCVPYRTVPVRGNHYGRTEELYQCEDCSGCPYKGKCSKAKGAFGGIKWNRSYTSGRRRGLDGLILEAALISCRFNLHKFHLKSLIRQIAA